MHLLNTDFDTNIYIQSETEFRRARMKGVWETLLGRLMGGDFKLLSLDTIAESLCFRRSTHLGLREIPLKQIIGSDRRDRDFTRRFLPRIGSPTGQERWRRIYTLAVSGKGFPPVELYKIDQDYFVKDGHHRISVANHLGWQTIQAKVIELWPDPCDPTLEILKICCEVS